MLLTAFFSDKGVPKTGLSPAIDVWEDDGTLVVNAQAMIEIAGGWYKYSFAGYDESKDYVIRADGGAGLTDNDRYCFASNEVGQVTEDLTDVKGSGFVKDTDSLVDIRPETDKIQSGIIDVPSNFMADVSALALEATAQLIKTETDKIQPDIIAVPNTYKANVASLALEATAQLIKTETDKIQPDIIAVPGDYKANVAALALEATAQLIKTETDKIQTGIIDVPGDYKADVSNLDVAVSTRSSHAAADIWAVGVRTLSSFGTLVADIWSYATRTLTSFGTLVADIWTHATRTLTSFGTLIADVWTNMTRTLTAGTKDAEIDAIKLETDKIQPDIIGMPGNYKADVSALALEDGGRLQTAQSNIALIKTETDKVVYVLGLVQENFRLKDQVYNVGGNLTSATIRIYGSAADCDADLNAIAEYMMTATYDGSGNCTNYKVTKV